MLKATAFYIMAAVFSLLAVVSIVASLKIDRLDLGFIAFFGCGVMIVVFIAAGEHAAHRAVTKGRTYKGNTRIAA